MAGNTCLFCGCQPQTTSTIKPAPATTTNSNANLGIVAKINKFIRQMGGHQVSSSSQVRFCGECLSTIVKTVEWSEEAKEVEEEVRSLQHIILKMMRRLTSLQTKYLEEMQKLAGKIKASGDKWEAGGGSETGDKLRKGVVNVVAEVTAAQGELTILHDAPIPPPNRPTATATSEPECPAEDADSLADFHSNAENSGDESDPEVRVKSEPLSENEEDQEMEESSGDEAPKRKAPTPNSRRLGRSDPCQYCGRRFKDAYELRLHTYTHTGERPYKCDLCPKTYAKPNCLSHHKKTHTNVKPHKCSQCPSAFARKDHLEEHQRVHTRARPFKCPLCRQGFTRRFGVKQHVKKFHPNAVKQKT